MHNKALYLINPVLSTLWCGTFEAGHIEANRRIYNHELVFFSKGSGRVIIKEQVYSCTRGTVIIIPPGVIHCTIADSDLERWCIHFDWEPAKKTPEPPFEYSDSGDRFMENQCNFTPGWFPYQMPYFCKPVDFNDYSAKIQALFCCGYSCFQEALRQKSIFLEILSLCFTDSFQRETRISPTLLKAKEYIDQNFQNSQLSISKIATQNSITPNHLCRLFSKELGVSSLDYINMLRIKRAITLLSSTSMNVGQIALATGFKDPNYFARLFKKKTGIPPSRYSIKSNAEGGRNSSGKLLG